MSACFADFGMDWHTVIGYDRIGRKTAGVRFNGMNIMNIMNIMNRTAHGCCGGLAGMGSETTGRVFSFSGHPAGLAPFPGRISDDGRTNVANGSREAAEEGVDGPVRQVPGASGTTFPVFCVVNLHGRCHRHAGGELP